MKTFLATCVLVLGTLALWPAVQSPAEEPWPGDLPVVDDGVRQLLQDRSYAEAVEAIDRAAAVDGAAKDYLTYLKGRALYLQGEHDAAVAVLDGLEKEFPESPWVRRARFAKAVALARKGDFRGAELIYRAEAEYLLSTDRKQQIADIYLEFADAYFQPPKDTDQEPDYQKALDFYRKALEIGPEAEKRIEVEFLVGRCYQKLGKWDEAIERYERFIAEHAGSSLDIDARHQLGECRFEQGDPKQARRVWQDLLAEHAGADSPQIAEVTYKLAQTWGIPAPGSDEDLALGTAALKTFLERFPEHEWAGRAQLAMARSATHRGRHEEAVEYLKRFLADPRYADCEEIPEARNLLGLCYQEQEEYAEALAVWREYLAKHPAHQAWNDVQTEVISTEYKMGLEKCEAEEYDEARRLLGEFLAKYPLDVRNPGILLLFGQIHHEQKKYDEAIADWRRLVSKHPRSDEASQGQYRIALCLEQELGKPAEALEEYRKLNWGSHANQAWQAVNRLTAPSMSITTERVFRSDETPRLKLTTRNVESVTVRVYEVDLETYFRKMHLARGVEQLDIALIDPDRTFEFAVPGYGEYVELESTVEVRGEGRGARG
ncbi:MAG TPA: tetratricopeptide repeat protein, partial [Thermoguttaceae bacterium]|nr:tetratricopeptide repeat protein [Thermoguttaceae bacterium]